MDSNKKLGLIGRNISYSFSKKFFEDKFQKLMLKGYSYTIFDLTEIHEVNELFSVPDLIGFNVTIPYKEKIIDYLDDLSDEAKKIGAVNCVLIENGRKTGYNTDAFGFEKTLLLHKKPHQESAIILGNGGAAKAVKYILDKNNIPSVTVSRNTEINYRNLQRKTVQDHKIIIQCTPVGTFPNVEECLDFPFEGITKDHLIIDLIYNPNYTQFIIKASEKGAKTVNGYYMLEQQAEKAWEIWNFQKK
ncbi:MULTISPECIES: shikimate dehydrogenase family protein [Chryseobacterium]|jgi:shikimate dehydrogenase|uniref:Shikimate dehydrogenase n=1 Tax=Chryseobacterium nepalense TaxID=1854498 RepID=A0ABY4K395_9FLAO|nr:MULTISPECIES: shikimate dehydrogenase [Chryseobacterium]MEC5172146.1 shikimate dehydrogenase [Chryseobacterium nepalense]UPQ75258.1 shikimate dehydrogenase [Chryseobacterium nepalense]